MMKKHGYLLILLAVMLTGVARAANPPVYFFSAKYFGESFSNELAFSFLTHHTRSPQFETFYDLRSSGVFREYPVYMRAYSILSVTYEPIFRMLEFGSASSLSLNVPLTIGLSAVDFRTPYADRMDVENSPEIGASTERSAAVGSMHVEGGGLLTYNIGAGATAENTSSVGLSLGVGYNRIMAPLLMNVVYEYSREDYADYDSWGHVVARLGLRTNRVMFYYMSGINPQLIRFNGSDSVLGRSYNRFSVSFRLES